MSKGVCIHLKNFYHVPQCHDVEGYSLIVTLANFRQTPTFKATCSFLNNSFCRRSSSCLLYFSWIHFVRARNFQHVVALINDCANFFFHFARKN